MKIKYSCCSNYELFFNMNPSFIHKEFKLIFVTILSTLLGVFIFQYSFSQTPADFSGHWQFNREKSESGSGGTFLDAQTLLTINQSSDSIIIIKNVIRPGSHNMVTTERYKLNGLTVLTPGPNQTKNITTQWSDDHQTLFVYIDWIFSAGGTEREFQGEDSYRLGHNRNSLTVFSTSQNTTGENSMILVYDRVK